MVPLLRLAQRKSRLVVPAKATAANIRLTSQSSPENENRPPSPAVAAGGGVRCSATAFVRPMEAMRMVAAKNSATACVRPDRCRLSCFVRCRNMVGGACGTRRQERMEKVPSNGLSARET